MAKHNPALEDLEETRREMELTRYRYLTAKGWEHSSSHLEGLGFCLWAKVIDGKTVVTDTGTALALESHLDPDPQGTQGGQDD